MAMPIIPWIGGQRRLADRIVPQFPRHTCYVEVFAGGAVLYFMRSPADVEMVVPKFMSSMRINAPMFW